MPLILGTNSIKDTGYDVDNSLRFDDGSSDYLSRTPTSVGNRKTFTFSTWFKRGTGFGNEQAIFTGGNDANASGFFTIYFTTNDRIDAHFWNGSSFDSVTPNGILRDSSAWMHIVVAVDTTQATASNRIKWYINGTEQTSLYSTDYPSQNHNFNVNSTDIQQVGVRRNGTGGLAGYFDGYLAETVLIDGTQLDATSFGEFDEDTGIWKPIDVSGLTFGTNGFYLDYENSGSLGADVSGNGNNFTVNNLTSIDQTTDTCTNNFCTLNPLDNDSATSFSEGNCKAVTDSSLRKPFYGTFHLTQGKWYWEVKMIDINTNNFITGISGSYSSINDVLGYELYDYGYRKASGLRNNDSDTAYGNTYANNDIIGVYLDLDNNKLYFAKNGTIQDSGTGISISDPSVTAKGGYAPAGSDFSVGGGSTVEFNFGNPTFSISSGNSDPNGYGNFEYSPNDGGSASFDSTAKDFYALNTKNLAEYG